MRRLKKGMNRKRFVIIGFVSVLLLGAYGYSPANSGELLYQLVSPSVLANGASVAGGALSGVAPEHIALNPAVLAGEQRLVLSLGYTGLIDSTNSSYGQAGQVGFALPTRYGVFTTAVQGVFSELESVKLGNSVTVRTAFSKDVTEKLYVGAGFSGAFGSDWAVNLDLGFVYSQGTIKAIPFLSDFRWGASLTGLGKPYSPNDTSGNPSMITPHLGLATTLVSIDKVIVGFSSDISFPFFQNLVFDTALQIAYADIIHLGTSWSLNLRDVMNDEASYLPTVSLSFKFGIKSKDDSFLTKKGWQQNEIVPGFAYRNLYDNVSVLSAGTLFYLGLKDTNAPEIQVWGENE